MIYVVGIDGGQSSTVAAIADETGRVLATGAAGPSDDVGEGAGSGRMAAACEDAVAQARRAAGLPSATRFAAAVVGLSGYDGRPHGRLPDLGAEATRVCHDAEIAHAGALDDAVGVSVLAGTGSVAAATSREGRFVTVGGWGYLFGDEGSAFWIAREALARTMKSPQAQLAARPAPLETAALARFEVPDLRRLARAFYRNEIGRPALAAFAPHVLEIARHDATARAVVDAAVAALAALAADAARAAGLDSGVPVALTGGMFADEAFYNAVAAAVSQKLPGCRAQRAAHEPVYGALFLAHRDAGCRVAPRGAAAGRSTT